MYLYGITQICDRGGGQDGVGGNDLKMEKLYQRSKTKDKEEKRNILCRAKIYRVTMRRNIETFPSKQMYTYFSLVERKEAEFFHNIDRRR